VTSTPDPALPVARLDCPLFTDRNNTCVVDVKLLNPDIWDIDARLVDGPSDLLWTRL
jgi:hypothetical protein